MVTDGYMCMGNMCMGMHVHVHAHVACAHGHAAWTDMTTHALCIACGYRTASYVAWPVQVPLWLQAGDAPLDWARREKHPEVIRLLESATSIHVQVSR